MLLYMVLVFGGYEVDIFDDTASQLLSVLRCGS
jgi:hypothetical protein